jgi:inorganic triphosphatase YgiF
MRALVRLPSSAQDIVAATRAPAPAGSQAPPPREIELKFVANKTVFKTMQQSQLLGSSGARPPARRLHSIYFDTENGDLRRHRIVLRMRRQRGTHTLTLKWDGKIGASAFERGELEVPSPSAMPDLALLGPEAEAKIMRATQGRPLQPCFATDITRQVRRIVAGASEIEAAFDTGYVVSSGRKIPVCELELELKSGDPADLYHFGLSLLADFPVRLGIMTKAQRGELLSYGAHPVAVRAVSPPLAGQTVDQAIGAVISSCAAQFVANWPAFEGPDKAEAIHQMRVAMRRLRAALALFNRRFPCPKFVDLRATAKRIASAMGDARNWDVFDELLRDGPMAAFPAEPGFETVIAATTGLREAEYAAVARLLAQPETTRFVLSLEAFVARRGWRNALPGAELSRLTEPASGFAAECLARLHRRVRKRGESLLDLPPEQRHEVRIALKNLRYAADFFGELFGPSAVVKSYAQAAAKLQDALGAYNDAIMVTSLVSRLDIADSSAMRAAGIGIGWYTHSARNSDGALTEAWRTFRHARPFWGSN